MFERFTQTARDTVTEASLIARDAGATTIEAEHVLLAVTHSDTPAARVLADAGLDDEGLRAALAAETARSLAAVGVSADPDLRFSPFVKTPRFGHSAKLVLERALKIAVARGDRTIGAEHLTLAALRPAVGTVPRALEVAGVDRAALISALSA
jgi:ATP-dependent Clp protease ATP-binding subunit ClpA